MSTNENTELLIHETYMYPIKTIKSKNAVDNFQY